MTRRQLGDRKIMKLEKEPKTVTRRERVVYIINKIQKIKASIQFIHSFFFIFLFSVTNLI